ncbi:hypothetical protein [Pantoea sp. BAV 3049]|uniref:hypothetical protein n=1 Tax=Pantoea sp. BAV 3049 TaxID=2654188 RepID=UPI00131B94B9|nr:hypothetical protein [Pantoea sp. BAV 3049]
MEYFSQPLSTLSSRSRNLTARLFFRERYERKSCIAFMDKHPLVIDLDCTLDVVAQQMVACRCLEPVKKKCDYCAHSDV